MRIDFNQVSGIITVGKQKLNSKKTGRSETK